MYRYDVRRRRGALLAILLAATALPGMAFAGIVVGTVTDSSATRALQSAEVELVELGRVVEAAPDGGFRFPNVPEGRYTLRARYAGADEATTTVQVTADGTARADLALAAANSVDALLVVGQRANLASAISRQRAADGVESVLTRDAVGQFPDQNVAEALRRAPGVNILNDQGEGRFVSVRGLDPNLNAASINGVRTPAPEADVRSVALDVVPTELVESIEIKKSLTPDMDADTIGASIEINTTSAFDRQKPYYAATAEGSLNDRTGRWSPKGSVDFATRLTDNLGVAGGLSYYRRRFATDNAEMEGWTETKAGVVFADTLEYRDYDVTRRRFGATLSLDWRATPSTTLYARSLFSRFADQEYRRRLTFDTGDASPVSGNADRADFLSGPDDDELGVERDLKDRFEEQKITSLSAGGKTETGPWRFDYQAAYSEASERENGSLDPVVFSRDFDKPGELGVTFDYRDMVRPGYGVSAGQSAFSDPTEYEFDSMDRTTLSDSRDREYTFRADVRRSFALDQGGFDLQLGGKARLRKKTYNLTLDQFDGFNGTFTLADVLGEQSYGLADIEPVTDCCKPRSFFDSNRSNFELDPVGSMFESAVSDYRVDEDIYAGYLLGRYSSDVLRVIGGVRVERTRNDIQGARVELVEEGGTRNGVELDEDTVFVTPETFKRDYTSWLPSLNLRYQPTRDVVLRGGAYRSVVRPNIGQLAPRFLVEENDEGEREGEFGNPALKPYKAWNVDLSAEYYFAPNAVVQAGFFYKSIKDFIVSTDNEDGVFNGVAYDEASIPVNGDKATVKGLEFSYSQALTFLPKPFDGFLVNFNYTYTDAQGDVPDDGDATSLRRITLPAASKNTFNAVLGYERGPVSIRLAGTYRDKYLDELGGEPEEDRYVRDHFQFDVSAKYRLTPNVQLFADFVNLLNEPYVAYQTGPKRDRLLQYEVYGWTGKFGVRLNF